MSRASRRQNSSSASLFPFLAVLLCTMGVLVVLLVVMASVQLNQAERRQLAQQSAEPKVDEREQERLRQQLAFLDEQGARLAEGREQIAERLRHEQARLAQIEDNLRRRQERLDLLRAEIAELKALDGPDNDDLVQARKELERQQQLLADAKAEVEELREQAGKGEQRFAIVPYTGPNGVRRQPIYIECRVDRLVLQPEGIELTPSDFNDAMLAGGPLPSAIRAAQLYYSRQGTTGEKQAYPLVLARPDSSGTLARVLGTLDEVNLDFGYEVVEQDWQLDYSAADPALSLEIERAVHNARLRLAALEEQAPRTFAANQLDSFDLGPSLLQRVKQGELPSSYQPMGGRSQSGGADMSLTSAPLDMRQLAAALSVGPPTAGVGSAAGNGAMGNSAGGGPGGNATRSNGVGFNGAGDGGMPGSAAGGGEIAAAGQPVAGPGQPPGQRYPSQAGAAPSGQASQAVVGAAPPAGEAAADSEPAGAQAASLAQTGGQPGGSSGDPSTGGQSSGGGGGGSGQSPGASSSAGGMAASGQTSHQGGSSKGAPTAGGADGKGMALVRTIKVVVAADKLVVRSSSGATEKTIPLADDRRAAATSFVKAVRNEVMDWGIAGQGLRWQPELEMSVAPGGEQIAENLAGVLRQSGVPVRVAMLPK